MERRLAGMLVLAGAVRENPFERSLGRSLLNLPAGPDKDVLGLWADLASEVADRLSLDDLPVRIVLGGTSQIPTVRRSTGVTLSVETDPVELRGPGGVLADLAAMYGPDDYLFVVSGHQLPIVVAETIVAQLSELEGDIVLWSHVDGTPATMYRIRAGVLADSPAVGYVDFKEQLLPKLAADHDVRVSRLEESAVVSIRTMKDYLAALRLYYRGQAEMHLSARLGRWDDPWQPVYGIVEYGANVAGSVDLFDSVVLAGARVEDRAILIRSVICPGAVISAKETVRDELACSKSN